MEDAQGSLRDQFGDVAVAAKLIRRSKKRGRPIIWKAFVWTLVTIVAAIVSVGSFAAWLVMDKPTPTFD